MAVYLKIYDLFLPNDTSRQFDHGQNSESNRSQSQLERAQNLERSKFYKFMLNVEKVFYYLQDQFSHGSIHLEDILNFLMPDLEEAGFDANADLNTTLLKDELEFARKRN